MEKLTKYEGTKKILKKYNEFNEVNLLFLEIRLT